MKKYGRSLLVLIFLAMVAIGVDADNSGLDTPMATFSSFYEIDGLSAQLFSDKQIIVVAGNVRNVGDRPLRGYAVIHFRDSDNNDIGHVETEVNDSNPFRGGKSAAFDVAVQIGNAENIENVSVEFVEQ
jgi:hypothetical protein